MASSSHSSAIEREDEVSEDETVPQIKKSKYSGSFKYKTKFNKEWMKAWPFIAPNPSNPYGFRCNLCCKLLSCAHQGISDLQDHIATQSHQRMVKEKNSQTRLSFPSSDPLQDKVIRAEVKVANFMVEHNVPFAVADHLSPLLRDIFHDSQIAKQYASARTKTTCMLNLAIAPHFQAALVEEMKANPFSLLVDGSNDTGLEKLNPLTVRIFDINRRQVVTHLLDMCTTSGCGCGTSDAIFGKIDSVLEKHHIPWHNCIGFGVDNTSVNVGLRHSIMTHVKQQNAECYFMGCPCHFVHNVAGHASESLQKSAGFDVEDICVDMFYWFDKSTKRKGILREFCSFCDSDYHEIVRYVSVRWLSLEKAVNRILQLYRSLESYFKSEAESQARFKRLAAAFEKPMTEVYLFFYQSVLPTFTQVNLLLQREDPNIYLIADAIRIFLKKLLSKFVTIQVIRDTRDITKVDFQNPENQLSDSAITIGIVTKQLIQKLLNEGDIDEHDMKKFYAGVRAFYVDAAAQTIKKLPFDDSVLNHARFLNFEKKEDCTFDSVEYFAQKYPKLLPLTPVQMDMLQEEFTDYQLLEMVDIPDSVWKEATIDQGDTEASIGKYHRMDVLWAHLSSIQNVDCSLRFKYLSAVAKLVLVIPHSNAGEERVFSLIKQNKTHTRSSLDNDGTLSSIIQVKLANCGPCIKWEPPKELLKASKRATKQYNDLHKSS